MFEEVDDDVFTVDHEPESERNHHLWYLTEPNFLVDIYAWYLSNIWGAREC